MIEDIKAVSNSRIVFSSILGAFPWITWLDISFAEEIGLPHSEHTARTVGQ